MSGFAQEQIDIETRFAASFADIPVKYPNSKFKAVSGQPFCELIIRNTTSLRASVGEDTPLHRAYGVIIANIHVTKGDGAIVAKGYADTAAAIFRDVKFSGITCRSPNILDVGDVEGWYVVSMNVAFFRDKIF